MSDSRAFGGSETTHRGPAYADAMASSAADIAVSLRARLPNLPTKKLHKLLYYCQGHHLAAFGRPLFPEAVTAFDMGPVVGSLWFREKESAGEAVRVTALSEAELNTIGYVINRYGSLSGRDLEILTHHEDPWLRADETREPGGRVRIEREWIQEYFSADSAKDELPDPPPELLGRWRELVAADPGRDVSPDSVDELRRRLGRSA